MKLISETYIDFCFIRENKGSLAKEIDEILSELFKDIKLNWYLEEKEIEETAVVVAEIKGMSRWQSEEETISFIENNATDLFWSYLQGYKIFIYPVKRKGANCSAS